MLNVPCGLAAKLANDFPEGSDAAERGTGIHAEIAAALSPEGGEPVSQEAKAAVRWASAFNDYATEKRLQLRDPETGEVITEGTADFIGVEPDNIAIVDWKTGRPENVPAAEDNLQLLAYGLAEAIETNAPGFRCILAFLDGEKVTTDETRFYPPEDWWALLDRVKAAASRTPEARPGSHCAGCYQRKVCPNYRERAALALTLLPRERTEIANLTDDEAAALVLRAKAVREAADLAEELAKAHVLAGGRIEADGKVWAPVTVNGRRSGPSLKDLEAQGLGHLIRPGAPTTRWDWRKA